MTAGADVSQPGTAPEPGLNSLDPAAIRRLRAQISGLIITPESAEYGAARMVFNRAFDRRPALVARCADASDVVRILDFAQKQNLPVAVRGGGHNRATSNPDLFWAIRGGGGNFGVATALEYQLHPVTNVLAGTLLYPPGQIAELLHGFVKLVAAAPDELTIVGQVLPSEKGAGFLVLFFHAGDPSQGQDLLRNWRALKPQQDTVRDTSYLRLKRISTLIRRLRISKLT